ncbi:MAG: hypothetical protein HY084_11820 [Gemmatimonadetes bacterium]|nr:hypothetical protein [Gemmatimonadota bacterium]
MALTLAAIGLAATPLFAHEKGVLTLNTKQAAPGDTLVARGSKLAKGAALRIEIRGALKTFPFGSVHTDAAGKFEMRLPIPADAKPGAYRVVAIASDGDVSAQENLVLRPVQAAAVPSMTRMPDMTTMHVMESRATAAPADIRVVTSSRAWTVIIGLIVFALVGGVLLLRGATSGSARTA